MDAVITAEPMQMGIVAVEAAVTTVVKVADLVRKLQSLFDPAAILAPLLAHNGTSLSAVAPDFNSRGGVSAWAIAA